MDRIKNKTVTSRLFISHLFDDEDTAELIKQYGVGLESIEFSITDQLDNLDSSLEKYKKRLQYMNPKRLILHGPFLDLNPITFDSGIMEVTWRRFNEAAVACRELGGEKIVLHTGYHPDIYLLIGWPERMADFFEKLADNNPDICFVIENVFDRKIEPFSEFYTIMNERGVSIEKTGMCLDIGHAACYSKLSPCLWQSELAAYITHYHLHDNHFDSDLHLALGKGRLPLHDLFKMINRNATYTIENSTKKEAAASIDYFIRSLNSPAETVN